MLQFVLGRAGSGKTEYVRKMLVDMSLSGKAKLIMIVPEQYSFETEKSIMTLAGPVRADEIRIFSFTRLADTVFRQEGGVAGKRLSDGGRRILMSMAIEACKDNLEVYASAAKGNRLTDTLLTAVNEMKMCSIEPENLMETAKSLSGRGLGRKLHEISLIYGTYEALVEASYLDSRDDLTRLAETLEISDFFKDCTVVIDSFEGFTLQEIKVITQILRKAESLVVTLCTDDIADDGVGLFALVNRTKTRLSAIAKENNIKLMPPVKLFDLHRYKNENLELVEQELFCSDEGIASENSDGIRIFSAKDVFEEADFVAAEIRNLVMEKGYKYSDFSVICRNPARYFGNLDVAFQKRDIPSFVSEPARVDAEPVMRFVLGAFRAASGFNTQDILEMLKTGVSGFSTEEISELENYLYTWKITGSVWHERFECHPLGFGAEFKEADIEALERLNVLRERIVTPLNKFSSAIKDSSGFEICSAVYTLLCDFEMERTLVEYCEELENAGEFSFAAKQIRIWDLLMGILDQMAAILGEKKVARDRFYTLLREVISSEDVSEIPQTIDEVLFGTVEQVRQSAPKVVFLMGAIQGEFPLTPKSSGVFSDAERKELIECELPLGDSLEQKTIEERYLCYCVAALPSEMLYVSYPMTIDSSDTQRSEMVNSVLRIFPNLEVEKLPSIEFFANSKQAAFSKMAANYRDDSEQERTLKKIFNELDESDEYIGRLTALERAADAKPQEIDDKALSGDFFGSRPYFSPSQIETYHNCKFRYFCQYGLGAKERRAAEVDVMQYGTLIHYLFERIFSDEKIDIGSTSGEDLKAKVDSLILNYVNANMGGFDKMSGRNKYKLERLAQSAVSLIFHVDKELKQSKFVPEYFELSLGKAEGFPPLKIKTPKGRTAVVAGTIDRADVYEGSDGKYMRVVDYKTGKKDFKLSDVIHGLNMQMLIYLAAVVESGRELPAGVLYMPSAEPVISAKKGENTEKIRKEAEKKMKMNGVLLQDAEIITAMEAGAEGRYIPASLKNGEISKTSSVLTGQEMSEVINFSKKLVAYMADELTGGNIEAKPMMKNTNACKFCPYGAVCGQEYSDDDIEKEKMNKSEVLEIIRAGGEA